MSESTAAASAPGKVLFAGGFLVLDQKYTGLVFGLNARIHVQTRSWNQQTVPEEEKGGLILVESPQFRDARWLYRVGDGSSAQGTAVEVQQIVDNTDYTRTRNKFVEVTIQYVLTYLSHLQKNINVSARLTIIADTDYYSPNQLQKQGSQDGFVDFGVSLSEAHKTGLGSSAALVTALVSSLLSFHSVIAVEDLPRKTIHNLAQAAHCAAQGKVGSGFDVAAAVYGSCLYRRFTPAILESVGDPRSAGFGERLHRCVDDLDLEQRWDVEISSQAIQIPSSLLLLMCDVDCGSETPGMVRKVLQWRKENPADADLLWTAIQQGSDDLCREFTRLAQTDGFGTNNYNELADIIQTIRSLVREASQRSDVPIEPDVITELLDYCTDLPGVVGGIAPGAGGYDAIALLVRNDVEVVRDLADRLDHWAPKEQETGVKIGKVRLMGVKQEKEGVRLEDPARYSSWT